MNILGYNYTVSYGNEFELRGKFASTFANDLVIKVDPGACRDQQISTLLHEGIEMIWWHLGIELSHDVIRATEAALYQFLTANGVDLSPLLKELDDAVRCETGGNP